MFEFAGKVRKLLEDEASKGEMSLVKDGWMQWKPKSRVFLQNEGRHIRCTRTHRQHTFVNGSRVIRGRQMFKVQLLTEMGERFCIGISLDPYWQTWLGADGNVSSVHGKHIKETQPCASRRLAKGDVVTIDVDCRKRTVTFCLEEDQATLPLLEGAPTIYARLVQGESLQILEEYRSAEVVEETGIGEKRERPEEQQEEEEEEEIVDTNVTPLHQEEEELFGLVAVKVLEEEDHHRDEVVSVTVAPPDDGLLFFFDEEELMGLLGRIIDQGHGMRASTKSAVYAFGTMAVGEALREFSVQIRGLTLGASTKFLRETRVGIARGDTNLKYVLCADGSGVVFTDDRASDEIKLFDRNLKSGDIVTVRFQKGFVSFGVNGKFAQHELRVESEENSPILPFIRTIGKGSTIYLTKPPHAPIVPSNNKKKARTK